MKKKLMAWTMSLCVCAGLAGGTGAVSVWAAEDNTSAEDTQSDAVQETGEESGEETADPDAVRVGALKGPTAMGMAQLLDADGYDFEEDV